ncbi:MAG: hypothetical protein IT480_01015 [Gammaproteobacteria bacterium]|nr:hypothetical protein [Gammaproteobacteria bacterium]
MSRNWIVAAIAATVSLSAAPVSTRAADAVTVAAIGRTLYLSAIYGSDPDPVKQVDEVIHRAHDALVRRGLGFGNMVQHTIFVKDGAIQPMTVLQRFHGVATQIAPSLKERRSVGTIIRVPDMPGNAAIMLEVVAGAPPAGRASDDFQRVPFKFGPAEIAETIGIDSLVFTAGLEAMDFEHGTLAPGIDAQMEAIVGKLDGALKNAGLSLNDMVSHNLYVKKGTDPQHVINRFHELTHRYAPGLKDKPSVGTLALVDGMAGDGFLMEMDAVAARPNVAGRKTKLRRVPYDSPGAPIVRSVSVNDAVFVSGEVGSDRMRNGAIPEDVGAQIDLAVRNIAATLKKSGTSFDRLVKARLFLKNGTADPQVALQRFRAAVAGQAPRLDPGSVAQTLLLVEGLDSEQAKIEIGVIARRR